MPGTNRENALANACGHGLAAVTLVAVWQLATWAKNRGGPSANAIMVIAPYWYNGTWVFDDPDAGLKREPFVAGVPEMIDLLVKDPRIQGWFSPHLRRQPVSRVSEEGRLVFAGIQAATITSSTTRRWKVGLPGHVPVLQNRAAGAYVKAEPKQRKG